MFATLRLCIRISTPLSFVIWGDIICIYGMLVFAFLACDVKADRRDKINRMIPNII